MKSKASKTIVIIRGNTIKVTRLLWIYTCANCKNSWYVENFGYYAKACPNCGERTEEFYAQDNFRS